MRITARQLRQIIREELLRETDPATTNIALRQMYRQDPLGESAIAKTGELYSQLMNLRGEKDPRVIEMSLANMKGVPIYLPTAAGAVAPNSIPRVTGVPEVEMFTPDYELGDGAGGPKPFPRAIYTTDLDGTVGLFTFKRVLEYGGKLLFEPTATGSFSNIQLTVDAILGRLDALKEMGQALQYIHKEAARGQGPVFDAARSKMPEIRPGKYLSAFPADRKLGIISLMDAQHEPEFFSSYP